MGTAVHEYRDAPCSGVGSVHVLTTHGALNPAIHHMIENSALQAGTPRAAVK